MKNTSNKGMLIFTILIVVIILIFILNSDFNSRVKILISPSPGIKGQISVVKLSIDHYKNIEPDFFIIHNGDTSLLFYHSDSLYAGVELVYNKSGNYPFNGFVNYINQDSIKQTKNFSFQFVVK